MMDDLGRGNRGGRGRPFAAGTALDPELEVTLFDFEFRKSVFRHQLDDLFNFFKIHRRGINFVAITRNPVFSHGNATGQRILTLTLECGMTESNAHAEPGIYLLRWAGPRRNWTRLG